MNVDKSVGMFFEHYGSNSKKMHPRKVYPRAREVLKISR